MKIKPIEGATVYYPGTRTPLPAAGDDVSFAGADGTYWQRRLNDGSVAQAVEMSVEPESKEADTSAVLNTRKGGRQ